MKELFVIVLVARNPNPPLIQIDLQPEGANVNPQPLPKNEDERQVAKFVEAQQAFNPFLQQMAADMPKPHATLVVSVAQYESLGRPAVGEKMIISLAREGDHGLD